RAHERPGCRAPAGRSGLPPVRHRLRAGRPGHRAPRHVRRHAAAAAAHRRRALVGTRAAHAVGPGGGDHPAAPRVPGVKRIAAMLAVAGLIAACGGGSAVHLTQAGPGVAAQVGAPKVTLPAAELRRYQAFRSQAGAGAPLILVYHDVQPRPDPPYTVSPRQLATHLAMLRAAGFTPVTGLQVVA